MCRIVLFGGAFNPVHREHVAIAEAAVKTLSPQKLIIIPTAVSPHKSGGLSASAEDRLKMCRTAFAHIPCAEVSDYEISQGGISYSYLTCRHFRQLYPEAELYFLVGGDMLASFPSWKNPREILSCVRLAAAARESGDDFSAYKKAVEGQFGTKVKSVHYVGEKVSSTRVRALACLGEDISAYVLPAVGQYIKRAGLYFDGNLARAKHLEKPSRWQHSVRVAAMCAENARRASITEKDAITMGALHDASKNLPKDSPYLKDFVPPEGVPSPVMHQYSGAYVAQKFFGVTDENLLNAIRYHTSGRAGMSDAEILLYLCDMLEEGRSFPGIERLRAVFTKDMQLCMLLSLQHQVDYLRSTGGDIYPLTKQAYLYLKEKLT